jgi:hypothetical protein
MNFSYMHTKHPLCHPRIYPAILRLGIKDVLVHQSELAQRSAALLGSSSQGADAHSASRAMECLSTLRAAVMQDSLEMVQKPSQSPTHQRQQLLLLSLAELQREVVGAEERQQQHLSVLEQYQAVCEVLSGQLVNTVNTLAERNSLIDALSRKQSELTAKLALQARQTSVIIYRHLLYSLVWPCVWDDCSFDPWV